MYDTDLNNNPKTLNPKPVQQEYDTGPPALQGGGGGGQSSGGLFSLASSGGVSGSFGGGGGGGSLPPAGQRQYLPAAPSAQPYGYLVPSPSPLPQQAVYSQEASSSQRRALSQATQTKLN